MSHELRTPLTSIRGSLGLLTGGAAGKMPEAAGSLLDIEANNCERLVRLINDILDMEKIESGTMTFAPSPVDLVPLVRVRSCGGKLRVSVADNGPGIPLEFQPRVFEKFTQAASPSTRRERGTGLGLSISQAIVERHGGRIWFETEVGAGTTFYFELADLDAGPINQPR